MNRSLHFYSLLFILFFGWTQSQAQQKLESKITAATVYLNGAELVHNASGTLKAGSQTIIITKLSQHLNVNSIQLTAPNNCTVLSITPRKNYFIEDFVDAAQNLLKDSLKALNTQLKIANGKLNVFNEEKNMILSNKTINYGTVGFSIEDIEDLSEFYRNRLSNILMKQIEFEERAADLTQQINRIQNQLNEIATNNNKLYYELEVDVVVATGGKTNFKLNYLIDQAKWEPSYDIRAQDTKSDLQVKYNASISQNSGLDWNNIALNLSTGNPYTNNTLPIMQPWQLYFYTPVNSIRSTRANMYEPMQDKKLEESAQFDLTAASGKFNQLAQTESSSLNVSFAIAIPYSIPNDNKPHKVNIQNLNIPASYEYQAIPKKDAAAFLIARATDWGQYNLLSGTTNIYFENTFVGQSYINTELTNDTLNIDLGKDQAIKITRVKETEFCNSSVIGSNKKEEMAFKITALNNRSEPIKLKIFDQIPLSTNKEISVDYPSEIEPYLNKTTGEVKWEVQLEPKQSFEVNHKYTVKLPKDRFIILE